MIGNNEKDEFIKVFLAVNNLCQQCKQPVACKYQTLDKCLEYNIRLTWEILELKHKFDEE